MRTGECGARGAPRREDLVLDFSGMGELDVRSLALLLTARELACAEDRSVWSTGLPIHTRWALSSLGLDDYFPPLPVDLDTPV